LTSGNRAKGAVTEEERRYWKSESAKREASSSFFFLTCGRGRERERIIWMTWPIGASRTLDLIGDGETWKKELTQAHRKGFNPSWSGKLMP